MILTWKCLSKQLVDLPESKYNQVYTEIIDHILSVLQLRFYYFYYYDL